MQPERKAHVTPEQIDAARNADLLTLIQKLGHEVKRLSATECCLVEHDSFKISHNLWRWHSQDRGGGPIDFIMHYPYRNQCSFPAAVQTVLGVMGGREITPLLPLRHRQEKANQQPPTEFVLPPRYHNFNRAFAYLTQTRGLDSQIVAELMRAGKLYESDKTHNAVFVGFDQAGTARYASQRGTLSNPQKRFIQDVAGSSKDYGFVMEGKSGRVYVFESPIDCISHATLTKLRGGDYKADTRLSLGCVSPKALLRYLEEHPQTGSVVLCLDNDPAGREGAARIKAQIPPGYSVDRELPANKDYNEDLLELISQSRVRGVGL